MDMNSQRAVGGSADVRPSSTAGRVRLMGYPGDIAVPAGATDLGVELTSYSSALALPLLEAPRKARLGGVYESTGRLIVDSQRAISARVWRSNPPGWRGRRTQPEWSLPPTRMSGRSFFGGHYSPGFGHVLLEIMARFWPDADYGEYDQIICYPRRPDFVIADAPYFSVLLDCLGAAPSQLRLVQETPLLLDQLDVATSAFLLKSAADRRFFELFDRIGDRLAAANPPVAGLSDRIYLSRSRLDSSRRATNEERIEDLMRKRGFTVHHPQEMAFSEQVARVRAAQVVAGCDGSALHLVAFARPGTRLLAIDARAVPSQFVLDAGRGVDALHVLAVAAELTSRTGRWTADLALVEQALDDVVPAGS